MTSEKRILDNRRGTVGDFLRAALRGADVFRAVTAYFSVNGFDLLSGELRGVKDSRFLFGDPSSAAEVDKDGGRQKSFLMNEGKLELRDALRQKPLAKACAEWIRGGAKIRSVRHGFLHGKMYIADSDSQKGGGAVLGSSNFTRGGLSANLEINLAVNDEPARAEMREWFDKWWADAENTKDVTDEVLKALERMGAENTPKFVYYKTLFEIFRRQIDERDDGEKEIRKHLFDTGIWQTLYGFQQEGARHIIDRLRRMDGCILADSVGLGKTYTALAVIKYFELKHNARVLVLCPKKLGDNWKLYSSHYNQRQNPFTGDNLNYAVLSHTDLSRDGGMADGINLENIDWSSYHLVVIDESHNFRNASASRRGEDGKIVRYSRYDRLLNDIVKSGGNTKVLMLSATPVNTSLEDLRNQIDIMTGKDRGALREALGIGNFHNLLNGAQKIFKKWEKEKGKKSKAELMAGLGGDFFTLLGGVSISRSRRHVQEYYTEQIEKHGDFPEHDDPRNEQPKTDKRGKLSYEKLRDTVLDFTLSIYTPSAFLESAEEKQKLLDEKEKYHFNQEDRERFLIGMILMNFLKRMESSANSLKLTLERTVDKIEDEIKKVERFRKKNAKDAVSAAPEADDEDDEFHIGRGLRQYNLKDMDLDRWEKALRRDMKVLEKARAAVAEVDAEHDGKLAQIKEDIRKRAANPTTDKDGKVTRKMLVFTAFKDTAIYLHDNLAELAKELNLNTAMVAGDDTRADIGENKFNDILDNFAPRARKREADGEEIDILIATDCISEGQNLQDCDTVLNYDIHWNPVRLVQRFGRIDRIGSRNKKVRAINYWPTADMEEYLKLRARVEARMALVDTVATGEGILPDDAMTEKEVKENAQLELKFRDNELRKLRDGITALEDIDGSVAMSDFTLDDFLAQLIDYLEDNREALEEAADGLCAVIGETDDATRPGAIFFLRAPGADDDKREITASPIYPVYAVYVRDNGDIRTRCTNPKETLEIFRAAAANQTEPLRKFCDSFSAKTRNGDDMSHYDSLIQKAAAAIDKDTDKAQGDGLGIGGNRGAILPEVGEDGGGLELITWLVIMPQQ